MDGLVTVDHVVIFLAANPSVEDSQHNGALRHPTTLSDASADAAAVSSTRVLCYLMSQVIKVRAAGSRKRTQCNGAPRRAWRELVLALLRDAKVDERGGENTTFVNCCDVGVSRLNMDEFHERTVVGLVLEHDRNKMYVSQLHAPATIPHFQ